MPLCKRPKPCCYECDQSNSFPWLWVACCHPAAIHYKARYVCCICIFINVIISEQHVQVNRSDSETSLKICSLHFFPTKNTVGMIFVFVLYLVIMIVGVINRET